MNLDDFKPQWQQRQHDLDNRVDHVIEKVRNRMSSFDRTIWWRDMREMCAAVVLFFWYGYSLFSPQNWILTCGNVLGMLACVIIVAVMYSVQVKGRKEVQPSLPVEEYCKAELTRLDRQIWLLKSVNWWYFGPLFIALVVQTAGIMPGLNGLVMVLFFLLPFFGFLYWANQVAVRFHLRPLRQELVRAMDIDADSTTIVEDSEPMFSPVSKKPPLREVLLAVLGFLLMFCIGAYLLGSVDHNPDAPRVSPFTEIHYEDSQVIVTYQEQAYQWLELDGIQVEDITSTAKFYYWGRWQKRVSEDLVDVLWKMGHEPGDTVELRLRNLETSEQQVVQNAPMTRDNQASIWESRKRANEEAAAKAQNHDELSDEE